MDQAGSWPPAAHGQRPIKGGGGIPVACGCLQPDPHHQPAQKDAPEGGDGMKVPIKGPMALEAKNEAGHLSLAASMQAVESRST